MKNEMSSVGTHQLRLPLQTAPVNRTVVASALSGQEGVVPSWGFSDLWNAVKTYGPEIVKTVGPLIAGAL
jgi:hypothetical protein